MALKLITAPAAEPVTLAQAKQHLRVTDAEEDALILRLIAGARRRAENYIWRRLITQTWDYSLDAFPCGVFDLPYPPVQSITSVKYFDTAGAEQTLSAALYQADVISEPARIRPVYGQSWPSTYDQFNAVTVRFVCGYGTTAAVPEDIVNALLLMIGHGFEHREEASDFQVFSLPRGADDLLNPYSVLRF